MKMKIEDARKLLGALESQYDAMDEDALEAEGMAIGSEMIALRTAIRSKPDEKGMVEVNAAR